MAVADDGGGVTFDVRTADRGEFRVFIEKLIEAYGRENPGYDVRTLPNMHDSKVFSRRMTGGNTPTRLAFKKRDVYFIAWSMDQDTRWCILAEAHPTFADLITDKKSSNGDDKKKKKKKGFKGGNKSSGGSQSGSGSASASALALASGYLVQDLANARVMAIESNYSRMVGVTGLQRDGIQLGKDALRKALIALSQAETETKDKKLSLSCLTIMQMIPEAMRYKPLLNLIFDNYYQGKSPDLDMVLKQNDWSPDSKILQNILRSEGSLTDKQFHWTLIQEDAHV